MTTHVSGIRHSNRKPDFICVAPHKTGTTWLYTNLKSHPQVWLPPKKELWVLNQIGEPYLGRWYKFVKRTGMPGDNRKSFEEDIRSRLRQNILKPQHLAALQWWLKFLTLPYYFQTYHLLFPRDSNLMCGDITPNYYFVKSDLIGRLSRHNPGIRIIIILRDPVERTWSYTKMSLGHNNQRLLDDLSHGELIRFFDQLHNWWRSYLPTITTWQNHFSQVYVGYYDLLQESPLEFYRQVCDFLGIDRSNPPPEVDHIANSGQTKALPSELRQYLNLQYIEEVRELAEWSNSPYPKKWLEKMKEPQ